jgi:hypothetical protein
MTYQWREASEGYDFNIVQKYFQLQIIFIYFAHYIHTGLQLMKHVQMADSCMTN